MALFEPGRFILYQQPQEPAWPALVCPDDMAPKGVHEQRPRVYNTLILLMEKFEFAWATIGEMEVYDPGYGRGPENTNRQLEIACDLAFESVTADLSLDHWRAVMQDRSRSDSSSSSNPLPDLDVDIDGTLDLDSDIRAAIKLSLGGDEKTKASNDNQQRFMPGAFQDSDLDIDTNPDFQNSIQASQGKRPSSDSPDNVTQSSAKRPRIPYLGGIGSQAEHKDNPTQPTKPCTSWEWVDRLQPREDVRDDHDSVMPSTLFDFQSSDQIIEGNSFVKSSNKNVTKQPWLIEESFKRSTKPSGHKLLRVLKSENNQYDDAELEDHEAFVKFVVGPDEEPFHILKSEVDRREYFANNSLGANCMVKLGKNKWSFQRPCLQNIDPDDFRPVAEYLSTGSFGLQNFENADQKDKAFASCCSAWRVADDLVMEDLLDYVVKKIDKLRPWGLLETLAFAEVVYMMEGAPLPAYRQMKFALSELVADNYLVYLREYPEIFGERMLRIPEFLDDVHHARGMKLEKMRAESQRYDSAIDVEGGGTDVVIPVLEVEQVHEATDLDEKQDEREHP